MRPFGVPLLLAALLQAQAAKPKEIEEFKKRATVETGERDGAARVKVTVDDACLYDGPGKNGRVEVETGARLAGQMFVSVKVEGEEVARYWVRSLAKPVKFPPTSVGNPDAQSLSSSAQSLNGKSSCKIDLLGSTVYDGPGLEIEPKGVGKAPKRWYSIRVDGEIVYFVPAGAGAAVGKTHAELVAEALKGVEKPKEQKAAPPETHQESVAKVLARLNEFRVGAGLPKVVEDTKLSEGCQLHADYLVTNDGAHEIEGLRAHQEDSSLPGYSKAGAISGPRSNIGYVRRRERIENAIDEQLATFYHRLGYLDPMLRSVGVGIGEYSRGKKNLVVDLGDLDYTKELSNYPLLYPFPNQKSVPTTYGLGGGEIPEPVPKAESCGYPVTLWGTVKGWAPGESTASLKCGEEPVESWVFSRESEALKEHPRPSVVCILPKKPLLPNTTYTVTVKCKKYGIEKTPEWSKTWSFTTGKGEGESK